MRIRLLSDIHQEFYHDQKLYKSQGEDVLVLAGDINVGAYAVCNALERFANEAKHVVYVTGNHEYYGRYVSEVDNAISAFTRDRDNIHFLNPGSVVIDGVAFIGGNLWTNFRKDRIAMMACARSISDFSVIKHFSTDYAAQLHTEHIKHIREAYSLHNDKKKVIVTHFLPAIECISEQYRDKPGEVDLLNYYFANDYGQEIADMQNTTWLFGHTHDLVDIKLGDTRCIANPYGYYENKMYKEKIIEV